MMLYPLNDFPEDERLFKTQVRPARDAALGSVGRVFIGERVPACKCGVVARVGVYVFARGLTLEDFSHVPQGLCREYQRASSQSESLCV